MRADRASRRATGGPFGIVSGGINLALAPLRHRVFPCKFLMQFGLDVHLVVPRGSWRVSTRHPGVRALRRRPPAPLSGGLSLVDGPGVDRQNFGIAQRPLVNANIVD